MVGRGCGCCLGLGGLRGLVAKVGGDGFGEIVFVDFEVEGCGVCADKDRGSGHEIVPVEESCRGGDEKDGCDEDCDETQGG